ncbi:hypothetical protein HHK36_029376 [Tetracentron sinense]|uniref:Pseudouridine synthase RsuA/RluA-like domain-containing protein n=1 Tax=Tetracentron sinense TaxID=13715 RepID=A0A835D2J1_TETSI|nr:hypothetical protein HHK36_029376 [Tetracentron sinense]
MGIRGEQPRILGSLRCLNSWALFFLTYQNRIPVSQLMIKEEGIWNNVELQSNSELSIAPSTSSPPSPASSLPITTLPLAIARVAAAASPPSFPTLIAALMSTTTSDGLSSPDQSSSFYFLPWGTPLFRRASSILQQQQFIFSMSRFQHQPASYSIIFSVCSRLISVTENEEKGKRELRDGDRMADPCKSTGSPRLHLPQRKALRQTIPLRVHLSCRFTPFFLFSAKNRWAGKTIVDLFAEEFKGRPYDYYVSAVKSGRIQVDGQFVPVSYIVQSSQKISHFLHRHEPPVMSWDVSILQKEPDVLTVYKPASVPVHPCGQYRKNTVVGILQAEHGLAPLFHVIPFLDTFLSAVHRLDRLVSGLLILARSAAKADLFRQQIEAGMVQKQYIAKVVGMFPEEEQVVNANVNYNAREGRSSVEIRVHLQYIGHPIANDMLYLSEVVPGRSTKGVGADGASSVNSGHSATSDFPQDDCIDNFEENSGKDFSIDPMCTNCPNLAPKGYGGYEEGLWLHCVRYSGPGWIYECPHPDWAFLD